MGLKAVVNIILDFSDSQIKSDQNGIERVNTFNRNRNSDTRIKSDQNGIERCIKKLTQPVPHRIKSDQNGIERRLSNRLRLLVRDKIRPKWD